MHVRKLINLTPHDVVVSAPSGKSAELARYPARGTAATHEFSRCDMEFMVGTCMANDEVTSTCIITELPEPCVGTLFVVPQFTAALVGRPDLVFPADEVRRDGTVIGCRRLSFAGPWPTTWKVQP